MNKLHEFVTHHTDKGKEIILSFDDDGYLYLDGKKVLTEQRVTLECWVNIAIGIGGLSTFGLLIVEIIKF